MMKREVDSPYAWWRLGICMLLSAIGTVGMWSGIVTLPALQAAFGADRGSAALPATLAMIGFGLGGVILGRVADRLGVVVPLLIGAVTLGVGYVLASLAGSLAWFATAYLLIGMLGCGAMYAPLLADVSYWFGRRRGIAVSLCACGTYVAGAVWPIVFQAGIASYGWRATHRAVGVFCLVVIPPLALLLRGRPPVRAVGGPVADRYPRRVALPAPVLQTLLAVAGLACCVAMAMPQVHIVAYCGDLGYGAANGARMLSLMLGFGIVSRIGSGFVADRLGGVATLLIGSFAQLVALVMFLLLDTLTELYVISVLFGLFQGGLVPSYAIIVRESFAPGEAGTRVGLIIMMTLIGMAFGGWVSGAIYDATGSYHAAFLNGVAWNLLNLAIAGFLLFRSPFTGRHSATARPAGSAAE